MRYQLSFPIGAVIACLLTTISCQRSVVLRYVPVVSSSTGLELYAIDEPSVVGPTGVSSMLQCAVQCMESLCCIMYQINTALKRCELFNYLPRNYRNASGCCAFSDSPTDELFTIDTCYFPFTAGGQLFYSCAAGDASTTGSAWCAAAQRVRNVCASDDYGFVAQNTTVYVTFPTANTTLPLMSVYGWITILSRVNSSFPVNLSYTAYQDGFGDILSNFWLGLESTYQLTNAVVNGGQNYRLRFELLSATNHSWYSREYDWFYLDSSSTNYTLRVSTSGTGDAGDALNAQSEQRKINGKPFAMINSYCPSQAGPSWYPTLCGMLRFFGNASADGCLWYSKSFPVEVVRMMIKPISN